MQVQRTSISQNGVWCADTSVPGERGFAARIRRHGLLPAPNLCRASPDGIFGNAAEAPSVAGAKPPTYMRPLSLRAFDHIKAKVQSCLA